MAQYGPGDTHLIQVENVAPLTDEEKASAPAGGEFWAGQAIISGDALYGKSLGGWIYQALDGSRWRIEFVTAAIALNSSKVQLKASRFGDFGVTAESHILTFNIAVGRASAETRRKVFADLGLSTDVSIRLHAVSATGSNAVLAWTAFNRADSDSAARETDTRSKAYMYYQVSLAGSGADLVGEGEIIYDIDDIVKTSPPGFIGPRVSRDDPGWADILDREPVFDEQGNQVGENLTRGHPSSVGSRPGNDWPGGSSYSSSLEWLVMLCFDGEDLVPGYLKFRSSVSVSGTSFSFTTTKPMKTYYDWSEQLEFTLEEGEGFFNAGCVSSGSFIVSWDGPGTPWTHVSALSASVGVDQGVQIRSVSLDGLSGTSSGAATGAPVFVNELLGEFSVARTGRLPTAAVGVGLNDKSWHFILYSNNLIAVAYRFNSEDPKILGVFTPDGYKPLQPPVKMPADYRHFGSYNPVTKKFIVAATTPVNWT